MSMTAFDAFELFAIAVLFIVVFVGIFWLSLRINRVEEKLINGPSHADMRSIRDRMAEMSGQVGALADRQAVSMDMIRSIQTHLLDNNS